MIWESLISFFSFSDALVRNVVFGSVLMAISSSAVGCFTYLQKRSLVGDAVAHAVLPGICLSFMIEGTKNPLTLLIGAFITGWFSLVSIDFITQKTRIKQDTAIALVLSVFFGVGILLLTYIQHMPGASEQSGLNSFLFGNAISITEQDLIVFGAMAVVLLLLIIVFFKEFRLVTFDPEYAQVIGYPVRFIQLVLTTMTVVAVVIGIQAVGVVLMAAMLITPAAAARYWSQRLNIIIWIAISIGAFSGLSGAFVSYITPSPTGPWIVLVLSLIAIVTFFVSPRIGIIGNMVRKARYNRRILEENILKLFYHLYELDKELFRSRNISELGKKRSIPTSDMKKGLKRLKKHGFVTQEAGQEFKLTEAGSFKAQRVTRLHRLWELYLTQYLNIAPDHVHEDAESIEHVITPEVERKLEEYLGFPQTDPHESDIPSRKTMMPPKPENL